MADTKEINELDERFTAVTEEDWCLIDEYQGIPDSYITKKVKKSTLLGYKTYVDMPSQTTVSTTSGLLEVGKTYVIASVLGADDFTNVGFVAINTPFVASGTTPTVWASSTVVKNTTDSAPTANELKKDFTPSAVWSYVGVGRYDVTITGAFAANKTAPIIAQALDYSVSVQRMGDNSCRVFVDDLSGNPVDDILDGTMKLEIQVYL